MAFDPTLYVVDPETGDIKPRARKTLGQYLSQATSKSSGLGVATSTAVLNGTVRTGPDEYTYSPPTPNAFPVSPNSSETDGGVIIDPTSNGQATFVKNQEDMKRFEYARTLTSDPTLSNTEVQRTLYDIPNSPNETSLNHATTKVTQHISSVLNRNRFSDAKTLVSTNGDPGVQNIPVLTYNEGQMRLGSSENHVDPTSTSSGAYRRMRDEGLKILLRASGIEPNDNVLETSAGKALVTAESIGGGLSKVPIEDMRFAEALKSTAEREGANSSTSSRRLAFVGNEVLDLGEGDAEGVREPQYNGESYGVLNTYLNPFDGILPISMILNMIILLISSLVAALALGAILSLLIRASNRVDFAHGEIGTQGAERNPDSIGSGDAVRKFFTDFLGLVRPYGDDYVTLVLKGAASYTGFSEEQLTQIKFGQVKADALGIIGSVLSLLGSSGYYVVTSRSIVRNLEVLGYGAQDMARQFTTGGGAISGIESLATFIDMLRKSRIVRFVDTLARLGAVQEYQEMNNYKSSLMQPSTDSGKVVEDASKRVSRSRARSSERTLAWGFREANSMGAYLVPQSFQIAHSVWQKEGTKSIERLSQDVRIHKNRLTSEQVQKYESALDSEYVPFYMQDLRTNEILNFHAFIEDLSDSYSAEYNQVSSYGRMDPVQVYKGTTRSISMTFMLVATSREDFDAMWFSINKLTTLVYPEWSKGTEISSGDDNNSFSFIQPFSQVPTSSPLIRLRVGDLIRSNYSRFNLSRIFGLGQKSEDESSSGAGYLLDKEKINDDYGYQGTVDSATGMNSLRSNIGPLTPSEGRVYQYVGQSIEVNAYTDSPNKISIFGSTSKPYRIILPNDSTVTYSAIDQDKNLSKLDFSAASNNTSLVYKLQTPVVYYTPEGKRVTLQFVKLQRNSLYDPESPLPYPASPVSSNQTTFAQGSSGFSESSVVRSFEAAGGKGLAGVITNLTYTWYDDNTTWETDTGARAPMMCKVAIQFNPIHDIPMGLDNNGFMRAPAYPVGRHVNSLFFPSGSK